MSILQPPRTGTETAADPAAIAGLTSGHDFICILSDDAAACSMILEATIDSVADLRTRFVRVGNPLRSPLTIERLLIQAAGNDAESYYDRTAAELTRIVAGPRTDESRVVLVVEQAETLDAEAVRVLWDMSKFFASGTPKVQVLFAGRTLFQGLLDGTPTARASVPPPAAPAGLPAPMPIAPTAGPEPVQAVGPVPVIEQVELLLQPEVPRARRRGWLVLLLVLLLAGVIGAILWTTYPDEAARLLGLVRQKIDLWRAMVMPPPSRT